MNDILTVVFDNFGNWRDIMRCAGVCREWRRIIDEHVWHVPITFYTVPVALKVLSKFAFSKIELCEIPHLSTNQRGAEAAELGRVIAGIFNRLYIGSIKSNRCGMRGTLSTINHEVLASMAQHLTGKASKCAYTVVNVGAWLNNTADAIISRDDIYISMCVKIYKVYISLRIDGLINEVCRHKLDPRELNIYMDDPTEYIYGIFQSRQVFDNLAGLSSIGANFDIVELHGGMNTMGRLGVIGENAYKAGVASIECCELWFIQTMSAPNPHISKLVVEGWGQTFSIYDGITPNVEELSLTDCRVESQIYPNVKKVCIKDNQPRIFIDLQQRAKYKEMFPNAVITLM